MQDFAMVTIKDPVILILGEDRIKASRTDLISKSSYFAALFSSKFNDACNNEHRINYDIEKKTLQAFITWTSDSETSVAGDLRYIKPSLSSYVDCTVNFDEVLQLLQLSVLFAAESLVKDLTDLFACCLMTSEKYFQLWLLAKELNVSVIRDLAKAACLERICDLSKIMLLELSGEDFIDLLGNIHAQVSPSSLLSLVTQWNQRYTLSGEIDKFNSHYPFTLLGKNFCESKYKEKIMQQRLKKNIQCVIGHKKMKDNILKSYVYCWDGTNFSELVEIRTSSTVSTKNIVGRQVIGRGFDIYFIGGEYGLGTGRFDLEMWRYSTISKTWYFVTSLPEPRRHMAVVFMNEKLFLIGGVGRHRLKLSSVDIYDIYTGKWSKAADIPETFTSVPPTFQIDGKLLFYKSDLYSYDPNNDSWMTISSSKFLHPNSSRLAKSVQYVINHNGIVYVIDSDEPNRNQISLVEDLGSLSKRHLGYCMTPFNNQVANGPYLIGFHHSDETIFVEVIKITSSESFATLLVHEEIRPDVNDFCFEAPVGCFNVFNPNSLYERFVLDQKDGDETRQQ